VPNNYDGIDLKFGWNGDFMPGSDGDLADTAPDQIQFFIQQIQTVVASNLGDWEEHPALAADLETFVGEANTRDTALKIRTKVRDALVLNKIVLAQDVDVRVVPIGIYSVFIGIQARALPTPNNSLRTDNVIVSLVFDYSERVTLFLDPTIVDH
jgi:hypothetical protein